MDEKLPVAETPRVSAIMEELVSGLPAWAQGPVRRYGKEILACLVIVLLGAGIWSGYSAYTKRQEGRASAQMGEAMRESDAAKRIPALDGVVRQHGHTAAGRYALLLLASAHRESGQLDKAAEVYQTAIDKLGKDSVLGDCARLGLGYVEEARQKMDAAGEQYRQVSGTRRGLEAVATLDLARAEAASGHGDAALAAYNSYLSLRPQSSQNDFVRDQILRLSREEKRQGE